MLTYLTRRLLLLVPTLLGMTVVIFCVMALSPGGISAALMTREGTMKPQEKQAMQEYINARFGLDKPLPLQYLRWLNKVSPIGFATRDDTDPAVIEARRVAAEKTTKLREEARQRLTAEAATQPAEQRASTAVIDARLASVVPAVTPTVRSGDVLLSKPRFKAPDLGDSVQRRRPVLDLIKESLPITLLLNVIVFPVVYGLAIWSGIQAAKRRGQFFDVASGTFYLGMWSVPTILTAVMCIGFLANEKYVRWFPSNGLNDLLSSEMRYLPHVGAAGFERGYLLDLGWHLVLPLFCLGYTQLAFLTKLSRGAVLENLMADYARTARAKGVAEGDVLYRHVFRNSLLPLITTAASILPAMLSGSVIVETIFGINGMGRLAVNAVTEKDPELVLSVSMVTGLVGLIGYLLADIGYAVADPRVSYDG